MALVEIEILKWSEYNPRKDIKHPRWFALSNTFLSSYTTSNWSDGERLAWLAILSTASHENKAKFVLDITKCANFHRVAESDIFSVMRKACDSGSLRKIRTRHVRDTTRQDNTIQNKTKQNTHITNNEAMVEAGVRSLDSKEFLSTESRDIIDRLLELWNQNRGTLPSAKLTPNRTLLAVQRLREQPDLDIWRQTIVRIAASDFCNGKGLSGWKADFDFLLKPDTWVKVGEGKFDNRKPTKFRGIAEILADEEKEKKDGLC